MGWRMLRLIMEMSWRWAAVRGQPLSSEEVGGERRTIITASIMSKRIWSLMMGPEEGKG